MTEENAAQADEIAKLSAALAKLEEERACTICLDAPRCVALLPCRHLALCGSAACAAMLGAPRRRCPVCREGVEDMLSVFM